MTESVLNLVLGKLDNLITRETNLLFGVDEQVRLLQHELQWMLMFIKDAEIKRRSDPRVKLWVNQLREITFHAEDVIDEFMVKIDHHQRSQRNSIRLIGYLKMCVHCTYHLSFMHELGSQIQVINTMTERISANKSKYRLELIEDSLITSSSNDEVKKSSSRNIRRSTSYLDEESDVVGLENDIKEVKSLLMGGEQRRVIVSIVGMGGLGKTTLANRVYNNSDVKRHFDCCAWVSVSQDYRTKELLRGIIKCVGAPSPSEVKETTEEDLRKTLREYLQSNKKKYLIVLDDVWDIEAWDFLSSTFPDQGNGSRVLITTRHNDIALHADEPANIYQLRLLKDDESWELFLKKIYRAGVGTHHEVICCPTELEDLGKKMVGRCGGLPLAIVVLGGILLAKDKKPITWSKVNDSLDWHLNHNIGGSNSCMGILALSYYDLPDYLKPIFLYLGIFPEDHEICVTTLIQYWVAEGFIRRRGKETLEDIAQDYLEVLIDKSMIQVTKWRGDGRAKYCRIHDLLRELSIREAEDDNFFHQYGDIDFSRSNDVRRVTFHHNDLILSSSIRKKSLPPRLIWLKSIRTYSIYDQIEEEKSISRNLSVQHLRSLICFNFSFRQQHLRYFTNGGGVKLLRVLELRTASFHKLPKEIGQLVHLNYLGLRHTCITTLPRSIGRLVNLQTLDVRNTFLRRVPNVFWKLHQLRHLYTFDKCSYFWISITSNRCFGRRNTLDNLTNLRTLVIGVGDWINIDGGGLGHLRMLRKLVLSGSLVPYKKKAISDSIMKLNDLRSLVLHSSEEIPKLPSFSSFTYLYKLQLDGRLEEKKLPELEFFPPNLNKLTFSGSGLESDPMVILQQLPNLKVLRLEWEMFIGKKMICSEGGFLQLQFLRICKLGNLEEWIVEKGALSSLRELEINGCKKLKMIPDGLREVTTLKTLKLEYISDELRSRVRENQGEDWNKIQHIPSVIIV